MISTTRPDCIWFFILRIFMEVVGCETTKIIDATW
nr:MAG TPA: hypothetical protein [Caudoviricetes sp.]